MKITLFNDGEQQVPFKIFFKNNGEWCNAQKIYVKEDGSWKQAFEYLTREFMIFVGDDTDTGSATGPGYFVDNSYYMSLEIVSDGYIIGGSRRKDASSGGLLYMTKVSKTGQRLWEVQIDNTYTNGYGGGSGTNGNSRISEIREDDSGNLYVAVQATVGYTTAAMLIKFSSEGVLLWQQRWAYPADYSPHTPYALEFNDDGDPTVWGNYSYNLPYPPGGQNHGFVYTFAASDGTRSTNRTWVAGPTGLSGASVQHVAKISDHFYFQYSGGVTFSPYQGQRGFSSLIKTNMGGDTKVAIDGNWINTYSNLYYYNGVRTNGTNLLASTHVYNTSLLDFHILDTSLTHLYNWRISNSTSGYDGNPRFSRNYVYDGDFCYFAYPSSTTSREIIHFVKFNVTTGAISWQNKMVGDSNNKLDITSSQPQLQLDSDGYLVYLGSTNQTELYDDASILLVFKLPTDGTGHGSYGNYTYSTSTEISISSTSEPTGGDHGIYASTATPTDYGSPGFTTSSPNIPLTRTNKTSA